MSIKVQNIFEIRCRSVHFMQIFFYFLFFGKFLEGAVLCVQSAVVKKGVFKINFDT